MAITGRKILCTRPKDGSEEFRRILENAGAKVIAVPMIEISPVTDFTEIDAKLGKIIEYTGVIFTSANGARFFLARAKELNISLANEIYAVGEKTKAAIEKLGYEVKFVPDEYNSSQLASMLTKNNDKNTKYLFPCGNISMKSLLANIGKVEELIVYNTNKPLRTQALTNLEKILNAKEVDCIAFFSPSAVTNFAELFPSYKDSGSEVAAIGKTTLERIKSVGLEAKIVASISTAENLGEEIIKHYIAG